MGTSSAVAGHFCQGLSPAALDSAKALVFTLGDDKQSCLPPSRENKARVLILQNRRH